MTETFFCRRCLYGSDHPLGITFDPSGLCSGCSVHEEKEQIDWADREQALRDLLKEYRLRQGGSAYDCVVPVSGAGDSYYVMHLVKDVLGLRPLAAHYNAQFNSRAGIQNLANLREVFNVDAVQMNVNPESLRRVTRATLTLFGSVYWHVIAGQTAYPVQVAADMGIPLIVWGAHQGLEQVGMYSHLDEVEMSRRYRREHDLMGVEAEDLLGSLDVVRERDISAFQYPDEDLLLKRHIRGIYLGNYFRWDPYSQHRRMEVEFGFRAHQNRRSFDRYDHADSAIYMDLHDWLKLVKRGFSKVTDQASREIRHGRMARDFASQLVRRYELEGIAEVPTLAKWLGASERALELVAIRHKNSRYWHGQYGDLGDFRGWSSLRPGANSDSSSNLGSHPQVAPPEGFTLIGRGYPRLEHDT